MDGARFCGYCHHPRDVGDETSDVREYLQAGADGALDKGVSAALQTDILARVYHDRFPDRPAGAAPKRARRE